MFLFEKKCCILYCCISELLLQSNKKEQCPLCLTLLCKNKRYFTVYDEIYVYGVYYPPNNVELLPISAFWVARSPWSIEGRINRTWKGFSVIRPSDILSRIMGRRGVRGCEWGGCWGWSKPPFHIHIMQSNLQLPEKNSQKIPYIRAYIPSAPCSILTVYMALR